MINYLTMTYNDIDQLQNKGIIGKYSSPVDIAHHCLLESARHYVAAEREYFSKRKSGMSWMSIELIRGELRTLARDYDKAYLVWLNARLEELTVYHTGLSKMVGGFDRNQVVLESTTIRLTYDALTMHYEQALKGIARQISEIESAICFRKRTVLPWED